MKEVKDPSLYRRLSEPFTSRRELVNALEAFFDEIRVVREKHKIPDVTVIAQANYLEPDKTEGTLITHSHSGDFAKQLLMLAQTYGASKADFNKVLERITDEINHE